MTDEQELEENQPQQQTEQQRVSPAALAVYNMSWHEKIKYALYAGVPTAAIVELFGAGATGLAVAALAGMVAAHWSEEIRDGIIDRLPAPKNAGTRSGKLHWLLTGQTESLARDEEEPEEDTDHDAGQGELDTQSTIVIPKAPKFSDMCHLITAKRLVLCWTENGPVYGTIADLLSMVIIGKPGRGKTTALMYYVAMLLKADAEVHVWDPHGSMSELDGKFADLHYTDDLEDIPDSITALRTELEERRLLYKRTKQVRRPLLLLVDELPVIGEYNKSLTKKGVEEQHTPVKLISDFVLQARKWNCYFIGAGQSTDADVLPTRVTENLSSRIVFYSSNRRATMAGIELEIAKKFLPVLKPDDDEHKGKMIFDCSRLSESILGAIPFITAQDIQGFLGVAVYTDVNDKQANKQDDKHSVNADEKPIREIADNAFMDETVDEDTHAQNGERAAVNDFVRKQIHRMVAMKYPHREIAKIVGLYGPKYHLYKQVCAEEGIKIEKEA